MACGCCVYAVDRFADSFFVHKCILCMSAPSILKLWITFNSFHFTVHFFIYSKSRTQTRSPYIACMQDSAIKIVDLLQVAYISECMAVKTQTKWDTVQTASSATATMDFDLHVFSSSKNKHNTTEVVETTACTRPVRPGQAIWEKFYLLTTSPVDSFTQRGI